MLEFIAEIAAQGAASTDYQVQTNVGRSAGQTIFHLHWHLLGDTARATSSRRSAARR